MPELVAERPCRRPQLVIVPAGVSGRYVVKDPGACAYFQIGEEEHFLLGQLDGHRSAREICDAFARRFDEELAPEELDEFPAGSAWRNPCARVVFTSPAGSAGPSAARVPGADAAAPGRSGPPGVAAGAPARAGPRRVTWKSVLYWRINLFDPDRLFNQTLPHYLAFVVLSASGVEALFNFNPLINLDGYYRLSDWLEVPTSTSGGRPTPRPNSAACCGASRNRRRNRAGGCSWDSAFRAGSTRSPFWP